MTDRKLLERALEAMERAYTPYSRHNTGAALECTDGTVHVGCSIEIAAFGATMCAEAAAVAVAVSSGQREFKRIAIISEGSGYSFPCGNCRQLLHEFSPGMEVLSARSDGRYVSYPLASLLPMPYEKDQLGRP